MSLYLIDILNEVTEKTRLNLQLGSLTYVFGPMSEIVAKLAQLASNATTVETLYPIVAVVSDIEEKKGEKPELDSHVTLPAVLFACTTLREWNAEDRYVNSFKVTLQPIYEEWMKQLSMHPNVVVEDRALIKHSKTDRLYWGKSGLWVNGGQAVELLDCIEVNSIDMWTKNVCKTFKNL